MTFSVSTYDRRAVLRMLYLGGTALAGSRLLTACGGSDPLDVPGGPGTGPDGLGLQPGPLSAISDLLPPDANGVAIPSGFTSRVVARNFESLPSATGYTWHAFPDGGATYPTEAGGWIYVSNSEVPGLGLGGAGALVFAADGRVVDAYRILSGTGMNCAGGKTPWGTWLSCEELPQGQVWECDPFNPGQGIVRPTLGRFSHEAVAVDPRHRVLYLTEDLPDGRFYRWLPADGDWPEGAERPALLNGRLQVMNLEGFEDNGYAQDDAEVRAMRKVTWKDAPFPELPQAAARVLAGPAAPGTVFDGGEGLWYYELPEGQRSIPPGGSVPSVGFIFFTCKGDNRVYALDVENQIAQTIFDNGFIEPDFADVDNVTVSPWGDILVAEDGSEVRIIVLQPGQGAKVLVQLDTSVHGASEICGPAFSPDGRRLYFSSQRGPDALGGATGVTFEVTLPEGLIRG